MSEEHPLLASACEFLTEALENHQRGKDRFAIVHAVTACELVLKERLSRVHPNLIYKNIDSLTPQRGLTVALSKLPQRLANFGVPLAAPDQELVSRFGEWRNQIVHHLPAYDLSSARSKLPKLLDFLARFIGQQLHANLKDLIPVRLYNTALNLLEEWQPVVAKAQEAAKAAGNLLPAACPQCAASEVLTADGENRVTCHLCGVRQYVYKQCAQCGRTTPLQLFVHIAEQNFCDECTEAAGDAYRHSLLDIERGK